MTAERPRSGPVRRFAFSAAATAVFVLIVLVSAGRATVWQAWVYAGISLALNVAQRIILSERPGLAEERAKPGPGRRRSDELLLGVGLLSTLAMLVTAGLELRYRGGRPSLSMGWFAAGVLLELLVAFLFLWALRENRFFSAVVRVQTDRGHAVCETGPYRLVRHPGNLGMILGTLASRSSSSPSGASPRRRSPSSRSSCGPTSKTSS